MTRAFNFGVKLAANPMMADQSGAVNQPMPTNGAQHGNVKFHIAQGKDYAQNANYYRNRGLNGPQLLGTFAGSAPVDQGADAPDNWAANNAAAQQTPPNRLSANSTINTPTVGQPFSPQTAAMPPKTPAAAKAPVLGKAGSVLAFGAKLAASSCSPCDMPNSPTNKKHMTGASPAVTEAGEKSEEIGKPEVVETEHSEAEAKQPEEGIKSAANFGKMLGGMLGAAKPAAGNAADLAASLGAKAKTTAARTGNDVVRINPATGVQETLARAGGDLKPAWLRHNEAVARGIDPKTGVRPGAVAPAAPAPPPVPPSQRMYRFQPGKRPGAVAPAVPAPPPVPPRQ